MTTRITTLLLPTLLCVVFNVSVWAQTSAFTYQGQLIENGAPANGVYDVKFELWQTKGSVGVITNTATAVSNGLFTVTLDFGMDAFTGTALWLEIGVSTNGGGTFVTLSPRQPLTSAPYAIHALTASVSENVSGHLSANQLTSGTIPSNRLAGTYSNELTLDNAFNIFNGTHTGDGSGLSGISALAAADGSPTNAVYVDEDGNVGIGTTTPRAGLEVEGGDVRIQGAGGYDVPGDTASLYLGSTQSYIRSTRGAGVSMGTYQAPDAVTIQLRTGNVGIGATNPVEQLEVAGRIVVGDSTNTPPVAGSIRWTGVDFEGYTGSAWVSLTHNDNAEPPPIGPDEVLVPGGTFVMGDAFGEGATDELPQHSVTVSAFYMSKTEVTHPQFIEVWEWGRTNGYGIVFGNSKDGFHPLNSVDWYSCVKWANARSEMQGLLPVYYTDSSQTTVYRSGFIDLTNDAVDWAANGYRLPTEAEWERAARGGAVGMRFSWSGTNIISHIHANYRASGGEPYDLSSGAEYQPDFYVLPEPYTSDTGFFPSNDYGLYDMAGNVWEWCWDWYDSGYYAGSPDTNPLGPAQGSEGRVQRGGSWSTSADRCRVADRSTRLPGEASFGLGFRLVRTAQ